MSSLKVVLFYNYIMIDNEVSCDSTIYFVILKVDSYLIDLSQNNLFHTGFVKSIINRLSWNYDLMGEE